MADDIALQMLKADLGLMNPPAEVRTYMVQLLDAAAAQIRARGAALTDSTEDLLFTASWAAWLYRKRDSGAGLPEMLRRELLSRLVNKVTAAEEVSGA